MDEEDEEEDNSNIGIIENEENEEKEASWFSLASRASSTSSSTSSRQQQEDTIDESQIPEVVDVAMEAVLDYMAEVLTPSLVIHQITEAIQTTLHDMSKNRKLRLQAEQRETASLSDDINSLSQSPGNGRHGLDLLADDWVWSGDLNTDDEEDGGDDSDPRGQDEDLWDKDMEVNQWDSTGRLFEDFQDDADEETDLPSSTATASSSSSGSGSVQEDKDDAWEMSEEDDDQDVYTIGIQDGGGYRYDDEDEDEELDNLEEYEQRERVRQRFQKRDLTPTVVAEEEPSPPKVSKRGLYPAVFLNRARRPGFAPDPRLENLLTQLMEPLLRSFIEEEFPVSCKRVQGELMDEILWTLDHKESETSELDQLVLLAELQF
ncbi:hypothetical protein BGZ82_006524 [Podila clonocystis]|nr:hypothetical protein BGZ82_006524 [Podila clonocystis]